MARLTTSKTLTIGLGALALWVGLVAAASAQTKDSPPETKDSPNILLRMTNPAPGGPTEGITRDDLRELPAPRMDRLSESVHFRVSVDDKCLPGEGLDPLPMPRRSPRRR